MTLSDIKNQLPELQSDKQVIVDLQNQIHEVKNENATLKVEVDKLTQRLIALEGYLIFQGVPVSETENCWDKIKGILMFNKKMSSNTVNSNNNTAIDSL